MRVMGVAARLAFAAFIVSLVIGLTAAFGTKLHVWNYHFGLETLFPWSVYIGVTGFLVGLVWAVIAFFTDSATSAIYGVTGFLGTLAVIAVPLYDVATEYALPPIHDISTDISRPPLFEALRDRRDGAENGPDYDGNIVVSMGGRNYKTSALQKRYYPDVKTIGELTTPTKLFQHALAAAKAMGWTIASVAPARDGGQIEATDTTFFFGFTDDIAIRVRRSGQGARLDIRSKSRVGVSDFGRNTYRIRAYVRKLLASM